MLKKQKRPHKAKLRERSFALRFPEYQAAFLEHLVKMGIYKSINDAILKITDAFISDLKNAAEEAQK